MYSWLHSIIPKYTLLKISHLIKLNYKKIIIITIVLILPILYSIDSRLSIIQKPLQFEENIIRPLDKTNII